MRIPVPSVILDKQVCDKKDDDEPFIGLNLSRCKSSTAGIRNARVFPEPVCAAPRTSLPVSRTGMDLAWTGVIVVNPISARPFRVGSDRSNEENGGRSDGLLDEGSSRDVLGLPGIFGRWSLPKPVVVVKKRFTGAYCLM